MKAHPELEYYYRMPVGGPDELSLEEHTLAVIENHFEYFKGTHNIFASEKEYLLCLALHDIGKPAAVADKNRHLQYVKTLEILNRLRDIFPITDDVMQKMQILINADPIGKYLNPATNYTADEVVIAITKMGDNLRISKGDFVKNLICYCQCDAGGYDSLRKKLFLQVQNRFELLPDKSRLWFNDEYETKFKALTDTIESTQ